MARAARALCLSKAASFLSIGRIGPREPKGSGAGTTPLRLIAATLGAALAIGACTSGDQGPPVPIEDLSRTLADALCSNIGPCCQEGGFAFDPDQCRAAAESELRQSVDLYATLKVNYDGMAARSCVDSYAQAVRACVDTGQINSSCRGVFTATLPEGSACTQSVECVNGGCATVADAGTKQCTVSGSGSNVHGKLGEACGWTCTTNGTSTSCSGSGGRTGPGCYTNDGLYCDANHLCAGVPAIGQACTGSSPCSGEAFCENSVCTAKRTSGSCSTNSAACAASAYCDIATRQCLLRKASGAACTLDSECQTTDRCVNGTCGKRTVATQKLCSGNL